MKRIYVLNGDVCFLKEVLVGVNEVLVNLNLNEATVFSDIRIVGEMFVQKLEVFIDETKTDKLIFEQLMLSFCERFPNVMVQSHEDINPFSLPSMVWLSEEGSNSYREIWHENGIPVSEMDLDETEENAKVICEICSSEVLVPLVALKEESTFKVDHMMGCPYCENLMALDIYL